MFSFILNQLLSGTLCHNDNIQIFQNIQKKKHQKVYLLKFISKYVYGNIFSSNILLTVVVFFKRDHAQF